MYFADRLKNLMEQRGVTSYRLAKEIGCTTTSVTNWLSGKEARQIYIQRIATFFGVSADYLLGTEKEKAPAPEGERPITFDDFTYAMYEEGKELTEMDKQILLSMARQLNDARKRKNGEPG